MRYIKNRDLIKESTSTNKLSQNLITDLCVAMSILNPDFLSNILDKGLKARYTENSANFVNDLKGILLGNSRLKIGKWHDKKFILDEEISKINPYFENCQFNIEADWNDLSTSRILATNILNKIQLEEKIDPENIKYIYWIEPNKNKEINPDLVIELNNDKQYPIYINKKLNLNKTISFYTVVEKLFNFTHINNQTTTKAFDQLTKEWMLLIYQSVKNPIKIWIEKFIHVDNFENITFEKYHKIKIPTPENQILGIFIPELGHNYIYLSDFLSDVYKNKKLFNNRDEFDESWKETKETMLISKIIEYVMLNGLKVLTEGELKKTKSNYYKLDDKVKEPVFNFLLTILNCKDYPTYYFHNNGNQFYHIPTLRQLNPALKDISIYINPHYTLANPDDLSHMKIKIFLADQKLLSLEMVTDFTGGEMSTKLSTKCELIFSDTYNLLVNNL